jgi:hypothetical protein
MFEHVLFDGEWYYDLFDVMYVCSLDYFVRDECRSESKGCSFHVIMVFFFFFFF